MWIQGGVDASRFKRNFLVLSINMIILGFWVSTFLLEKLPQKLSSHSQIVFLILYINELLTTWKQRNALRKNIYRCTRNLKDKLNSNHAWKMPARRNVQYKEIIILLNVQTCEVKVTAKCKCVFSIFSVSLQDTHQQITIPFGVL